jgi:endonuclease YncB( thermonuclease family)
MLRGYVGVAAGLLVAFAAAAVAYGGDFTKKGTVASVIDVDTINVRLENGKSERVRLIGIDSPERGSCWSSQATSETRALAQGEHVTLRGDASQATRDRYGRLLAYVWLPGGLDLGYQLIVGGHAKVYVYGKPFKRLSAYRNGEAFGRTRGLWKCGNKKPAPAAPAHRNCHPSYVGACLDPNASDYDCAGGSGNGPKYTGPVRVVGPDDFGLDRDGDGYACELS